MEQIAGIAKRVLTLLQNRGGLSDEKPKEVEGIRPRFKNATFENFEATSESQKNVVKFLSGWAGKFHTGKRYPDAGIIILGNYGTGKTHLAVAVCRVLAAAGYSVSFTKCSEMLKKVKETWGKFSDEAERAVIRTFRLPDLLVIDDCGVQFNSDAERNIFYDVVDFRYDHMRPTIITANCNEGELKMLIGERVYDRMRDDGACIVECNWESWRQK